MSRVRKQILVVGLIALLIVGGVVGWSRFGDYTEEQHFFAEVAQLGGRAVVTSSESTSSGAGRIPIIGELLTHQRHIQVFIDDPESMDDILSRCSEFGPVSRVWLAARFFQRSAEQQVQNRLNNADVTFYTP